MYCYEYQWPLASLMSNLVQHIHIFEYGLFYDFMILFYLSFYILWSLAALVTIFFHSM